MKKVVFLLGSLNKSMSANTCIAYSIISKLNKNYDIHIVSMSNFDGLSSDIPVKSSNIHIIKNKGNYFKFFYSVVPENYLYNILRVSRYLSSFIKIVNVRKWLVYGYLDILKEITNIDVIIPFCFPFESIIAAVLHKNRSKCRVVPYLLDNFSQSYSLHRLEINRLVKERRHVALENNLLKSCDYVIASYDWKAHIINKLNIDKNKIFYCYPAVVSNINNHDCEDVDRHCIVYAGALSRKNRNPKKFFKMIAKYYNLLNCYNIKFFIKGDLINVVKKLSSKHSRFLSYSPVVSHDIIVKEIKKAGFLLSFGNRKSNQTPSKIFELMMYNKAIIHFYFSQNDPVLCILEKYKNSICIDIKDSIANIFNKYYKFITKNDNIAKSPVLVEDVFYEGTLEYITNILDVCINS